MSTRSRWAWTCAVSALVIASGWFAIPWIRRSTPRSPGSSVVGTLKSLSTSQEQFKHEVMVDQDGDRIGEYGTFQELSGSVPCRGTGIVADPTFLSAIFGRTAAAHALGAAEKSGYRFLIFLPDDAGAPHGEKDILSRGSVPADADRQEQAWVCYAWPLSAEVGTRIYVVNQEGQVFRNENVDGCYGSRAPSGDAAFERRGDITGPISSAPPSLTDDVWTPVE